MTRTSTARSPNDRPHRAISDFITRCAWGDVWTRDGLDRRTRSAVTLAVLAALGREYEIAMHHRAAHNDGLSDNDVGEFLLHTGVYADVPAANAALAIAQRVLEQRAARPAIHSLEHGLLFIRAQGARAGAA